ncbi:MAG: orotidine-5'-phosphate decarboxylase [Deltaproteobacteria bacterium]|nr:orotidine-5'-phosphate decarboxylase [Deltaproteobacteria bacterium]
MTPADRLIFAMDVDGADRARTLADALAGRVGIFKVGLELFVRSSLEGVDIVGELSSRADVFLDLKLHDIPVTVRRAMKVAAGKKGIRFVTVHTGEGPEALRTYVEEAAPAGALGVTVLTSVSPDDMPGLGYAVSLEEMVLRRARWAAQSGCAGVVCSGHEAARVREAVGDDLLIVTPGIRPAWQTDAHDQKRVMTPQKAIRAGADHLVVGRPIRDAKNPAEAAQRIVDEIAKAVG